MNEKTRLNVFAYSSVSIHCRRRRCRCFSSLARVKVSDRKDACLPARKAFSVVCLFYIETIIYLHPFVLRIFRRCLE
jgi:hypothetical protein